jgi:hypothetical protein
MTLYGFRFEAGDSRHREEDGAAQSLDRRDSAERRVELRSSNAKRPGP